MINNYIQILYEDDTFHKNPSYGKESQKDRYLKYGIIAFFGGWPGVGAYYLWRRRLEVKKKFYNTTSREKQEKLRELFRELSEELKKEKQKFKQKLRKRYKHNENK